VKAHRGTQFRRWATSVLREYLLRGYSFNTRLNQLEDKADRRLAKTEQDVVDLKERVDFFVRTELPPREGVVFEGQIKDGYDLALSIIRQAKKSVVLIDGHSCPPAVIPVGIYPRGAAAGVYQEGKRREIGGRRS